jgi:hypothetical protein
MTPFTSTTPTFLESDSRRSELAVGADVSAKRRAKKQHDDGAEHHQSAHDGMPLRHGARRYLSLSLFALRAVALVAVEPELLAQDVLERELRILALAAEVAVDLVALLAALQGP